MAPSSVPWLLASPLLALSACAGWPRFADPNTLPPAFDQYPVVVERKESGDFPPDCSSGGSCPVANPDDRVPLDHLFSAGLVTGTINSSGYTENAPFDSLEACEGAEVEFGINGQYSGDLDLIKVGTSAGGLCMVLAPEDPSEELPDLWDLVLYPYNGASGQWCVTGDFLSRGKNELAASTHMGRTNFAVLTESDTTEYVLLIGIAGTTSEAWKYKIYLLPTRDDPRSCLDVDHNELTAEDFEEIQ
jgi:hypothetical protein